MQLSRFARWTVGLALAASSTLAAAQGGYPARPIKIVVPYAPGGPADLLARIVAEKLSPMVGQSVVIENKPGAGGHIGGEMVATAPADGYTLMLGTIAHNGAAALYKNLRYDPGTDLQPVILLAESPSVLLVGAGVPARDVNELLALARAQPGKLSYGSAGNGSAMHMAAELFKHMTQTDVVHVPYRGGAPAMTDLLSGQLSLLFDSLSTAQPHIKGGKVRALAVTSTARNASLPDLPTVAEAGVPGYASVPWYTISAAKGVPAEIVRKLNTDLNTVIKSPDLAPRWESLGVVVLGGSVDDALARNRVETARWSQVIKAANLSAN